MSKLQNIYNELKATKNFSFVAIRGYEGECETFTVNLTYKTLIEAFKLVPFNPDSDLFIQRETQKSRVSKIRNYLSDPIASFPSAGAIVENYSTKIIHEGVFLLTIPASSFRYLFDGQGRLAGISEYLKANPSAKNNTLTVKLYKSQGANIDNQRFTDWNSSLTKPNQSICQAMDSRAVINDYTKFVINNLPLIKGRIDFTKASVTQSSKSNKLWSLNQFKAFIKIVTGVTDNTAETIFNDEEKRIFWLRFITCFFEYLSNHQQIGAMLNNSYPAQDVRSQTIMGSSVWLKSIALTGKIIALYLMEQGNKKADWSFMDKISLVNFKKDNPEWLGRCQNFRGGLEDKTYNHKAMASYLLNTLDIPLPDSLVSAEEEVLINRAGQLKAKRENQQELAFDKTEEEAA